MAGYTLTKYVTYKALLDQTIDDLTRLQTYIYKQKNLEQVRDDHNSALKPAILAKFRKEDIVAHKSHPLSSAGYGLKAKFMRKYAKEYKVIGQLSPSAYLVKDLEDTNAPMIATNIRQMTLLRKSDGTWYDPD